MILLIMTELFVMIEPRFVLHYLLGAILTGVGLLIMRTKRKYEPTALISAVFAFFLVTSSIFFIPNAPHFIEPFWLLNIVLYVFFVLGTRWGIGFLLAAIIVVGTYLIFGFKSNILSILEFPTSRLYSMAIEFGVCLLLLGYIVIQFISANNYVSEKYRELNELALEEKHQIAAQNKEKTALLQEIHHRVKNNLQVVTSLLRLQSGKVSSEESKLNFQDAINRIMTMASIHQKMYEEENLSEIDLNEYFSSLLSDLISSNAPEKNVNLELKISLPKFGNKSIVPLALIITELVTNSLKHGFKEKSEGTIGLTMAKIDNDTFELIYFDNGNWIEKRSDNTLGLELIETFAEQLDGFYRFNREANKSIYRFELSQIEEL